MAADAIPVSSSQSRERAVGEEREAGREIHRRQ